MSDARKNAGQKMGQKGAGKKRDQPGAPGEYTNQHPKTSPDVQQPGKPAEQAAPHEKDDKRR